MNKSKLVLVLISVVIVYSLWQWLKPYPSKLALTEQEYIVVENLLTNRTPRCIGRYIIDLPESFVLPDASLVQINKQNVETKRMYLPAFEQRIRLREQELRNTRTVSAEDAPFLRQIYSLPDGMKGVIFDHNSSDISPDVFRHLEAHFYNNGVAFKTIIEAVNPDSERYEKKRKSDPDLYRNDVTQKLTELKNLLSHLKGRKENEIPNTTGLCIPDGFISGNAFGDEDVALSYQSAVNPRLHINFSTNNFIQEDHSLLERSAEIESGLLLSKIRTLMKGNRKINTLTVEEWLSSGTGEDAASGHVFRLLVNEKTGSNTTPFLSVGLSHGPLPDEALSENEVITFWEQLTATLRMQSNMM
ncbi:T6SS immunity protein Tli4 family protein [Yersinia rochesterensis]|uniref:Tle cognate immunity protein 4 C-terminal domain-containing protein n=1 Tax=Yersinia rochesterensis TaxID=1604335 RepID=A0A8D4SLS4_9GAMM|nr:T6SS immunity protein Tli4 family protein [Yersinia rochesterensis]AYD42614.1 hypothetical protein DXZ79_01925 [Yersinia rochesterensis]